MFFAAYQVAGIWITFSLLFAATNEVAWRSLSTDAWVMLKTLLEPTSILVFYLVTRATAREHWRTSPTDKHLA